MDRLLSLLEFAKKIEARLAKQDVSIGIAYPLISGANPSPTARNQKKYFLGCFRYYSL
ncbi:MAG: hypothetical protein SFY56_08845 [Bacteroidota bacterium]|nr:hypothetical protein [Bacteroidota bacterium]